MELTGHKPGLRLDALRKGPGETIAAFQHNNVSPGRAPGRTHDLKRDVADLDRARFPEPERFVLRVFAVEEAARRARGKGGRQIEDAVSPFIGADPGQHVAQAVRAEGLEA